MILTKIGKGFSAVSKFADAKIYKSVTSFFNTVQKAGGAMNKVGGKVGAYYDDIGTVAANKGQFLDELSNMTTTVKKSVTDMPVSKIAQVEDELLNLADKGDVHSIHRAKEVIDDLITNYYTGKGKTQSALIKHSKKLGNIIDDAVFSFKSRQIGEKAASKYVSNFQKARRDYSKLKRGFGFIKQKLINPVTGDPTQTGSILHEISDPRNIDIRRTLSGIDKFGTRANKFARELEAIEKSIELREFAGSAFKSAGRGLVIGATAGQILKRTDSPGFGGE